MNKKKLLALLMALVMTLTLMPVTALADGDVAQIGETGYDSLTSAISAASSGDTIKLIGNVTHNSTITLYKDLTLDLNGQILTMNVTSGSNGAFYLNGHSLTIQDNSVAHDGTIDITSSSGNGPSPHAFYVYGSGSSLTIESGNIVAKNVAAANWWESKGIQAVTVSSGSTFTMTGGSLTASNANNSGGAAYVVYLSGGTANISGGAIICDDYDTYGWSDDHLVYNSSGTANITGGKFKSPKALDYNELAKKLTDEYELAAADTDGYRPVVLKPTYVAQIGTTNYATLAEAIAAVPTNTETIITMIGDETIEGNAGVTVPADKTIILDLNGNTISNQVNQDAHSQVILNKGTLTIKDSGEAGTITNSLNDGVHCGHWAGYNYATNVITNYGTLVIESGRLYQTGEGTIAYAVDNQTNGNLHTPTATISGGTLESECSTVRQFCNSTTNENTVTMTGGTVISNRHAFYLASANNNANKGTVTISGGTVTSSLNYFHIDGGNDYSALEPNITGGYFTGNVTVEDGTVGKFISGGHFTADPTTYVVDGKAVVDSDIAGFNFKVGTAAAQIVRNDTVVGSYETLQAAIDAAQDGDIVELLENIEIGAVSGKNDSAFTVRGKDITIDGNNKIITANGDGKGNVFNFYEDSNDDPAQCVLKNMIINSTGYQVDILAGGIQDANNTLSIDNVHVSTEGEAVYASDIAVITATNSSFAQNGQYTTGKEEPYYAAATVGYAGILTLTDCEISAVSGSYAAAPFPSGGTINLNNTVVNGDLFAWIGNGAAYTPADSIININSGKVNGNYGYRVSNNGNGHIAQINVNGGVYTNSPANQEGVVIKEGYQVIANTNEATKDAYPYTVGVEAQPVAEVNDTQYTTLADAFDAANAADTATNIVVFANCEITEPLAVNEGKNITLTINEGVTVTAASTAGSNVSSTADGSYLTSQNACGYTLIQNSGTLTIDGGGTIDATQIQSIDDPDEEGLTQYLINNDGTITIESGTFKMYPAIKSVVLRSKGTANLNGGTFSAWSAVLNDDGGVMTVDGGTYRGWAYYGNSAGYRYAFAQYGSESRLTINNGDFKGVHGTLGVSVGHTTVTGGTFETRPITANMPENDEAPEGVEATSNAFYTVYAAGERGVVDITISGGNFYNAGNGAVLWIGNDSTPGDGGIGAKTSATITGGTFTQRNNKNVFYVSTNTGGSAITGGTYVGAKFNGTSYVVDGYEAVETGHIGSTYTYQVGEIKSTAIAKDTTVENNNTETTYTASRRVVDENKETISGSEQLTVKVTLSTLESEVATNNELPRYDQEKIVAKALEVSNASDMNVSIDVESNSLTEVANNKITYEVHPVATVTTDNGATPAGTFIVTNDMLSGQTFTIKLLVPEALRTNGWVKVTHTLNNGDTVEYAKLKVDNGYVTIADVTEFSEFELEMIEEGSSASAACGFTLALKNKIEIPFYVYNLSNSASAYTVEYSYTDANNQQVHNTVNLGNSAYSVGNGWYRVVVASFSARQIRDTVHVVLRANDTEIYSVDYSVSQYCTGMIEGGTNTASLKTLCKAMMDYGTAAQWNFGYNTAQASNYSYYLLNSTEAMGSEYSNSFNTENSKVFSYIGATLSLKSQTELNFYFTLKSVNINNYTFKVNGVDVDPTLVGSYYKVTASEITAKNLDKQVTVTVTNKTNENEVESYSYSPLNYAYYIQENSPTDKLKTVCHGLYLYWQAANDYLN